MLEGQRTHTPYSAPHSNWELPAAFIMMAMLWFKFILGLKYFELVSILFAIVPDYGNDYTTKENNN